jgi:hypothetical protein
MNPEKISTLFKFLDLQKLYSFPPSKEVETIQLLVLECLAYFSSEGKKKLLFTLKFFYRKS